MCEWHSTGEALEVVSVADGRSTGCWCGTSLCNTSKLSVSIAKSWWREQVCCSRDAMRASCYCWRLLSALCLKQNLAQAALLFLSGKRCCRVLSGEDVVDMMIYGCCWVVDVGNLKMKMKMTIVGKFSMLLHVRAVKWESQNQQWLQVLFIDAIHIYW